MVKTTIQRGTWYKATLSSYFEQKKPQVLCTVLALLFVASVLAQVYIFNHKFVWVGIEPFKPLPWVRILFSALTFVTIGAALYAVRFYQLLHFIFVILLDDEKTYKGIKALIWLLLMGFMYYYVQPFVIKYLNIIASFVFNVISFVIYLSPALGVTLIAALAYLAVKTLNKPKVLETK